MASNIAPDEDEPMHPAGLDMTRGSLRDILDGNDVNISTALPTVPQDTTNLFINPNQTLVDIIPDRNLGPLASLKITDADLIICNLNSQLNATVEKNDQSTALLRRMDQRQKEIKAELAALKAETRKQSCGAKMKTLRQYHHINMSILQVHLVIQCSPISLTQMMITQ